MSNFKLGIKINIKILSNPGKCVKANNSAFQFYHHQYKQRRKRFLLAGTHTGNALQYVVDRMLTNPSNRPHVKDFVLVVTDGVSIDDVVTPALQLREAGATVRMTRFFGHRTVEL